MRRAIGVALIAVTTAACAGSSGESGELLVTPLAGDVRLLDGDDTVLLDEETRVDPGDLLVTGSGGAALLDLGGGGRLELGAQSRVRVDRRPEVVLGSVLAAAESGGLALRAGGADIEATDSVFRVDRGFSVRVAVYRGAAEILGSGIGAVPALRQVVALSDGSVPSGPSPLDVRPDHPWDIRLLGAAIDLGLDLDRFQRGLGRTLPAGSQGEAVARVLDGSLTGPVIDSLLEQFAAAESVVAAEVSRAAADLRGTSLPGILDRVADLREQGAHWMVVAATWALAGTPVLESLERLAGAIGRLATPSLEATGPAPGESGGSGGSGAPAGSSDEGFTSGSSGSSGSAGGGGSDTTGETTTGGSGGGTSEPPPDECANPVDCVVGDVVDELGGGLPGTGGGGGILP
jgi:FecR protein